MDNLKLRKKIIFLSILLAISFLAFSIQYNEILFYPENLNIIKGENKNLDISFPFSIDYNDEESIVQTIYNEGSKSYNINGIETGESQLQFKLLGLIPVKEVNLNVIERPNLIPGGSAIGVRLNTKGVLVVAITDVIDINGVRSSPAKGAGLKVGDSIVAINDQKIVNAEQVVEILNKIKDEEVKIRILRNNAEFETNVKSVQCLQDNSYRLGVWVRDKTTGIGTLTYINPYNNSFGALGHGITDIDTGKLLTVEDGLIMNAKVSDITQGKKGVPGEIKGVFYKTDDILGDIKINDEFGIYGKLNNDYLDKIDLKSIPIAYKEEVTEGKAYILSTIDDKRIEKFEINIEKVEKHEKPNSKSMIIKISDPKLLEKTGGIVQGMSGSPIIQNDRLIGAVTHVFINDPTKGYGLFIEWMLEQDGKL
ncbi:MAG: SpoIVB peptidase [Tissierellaceae bacterium]|nr:SpoIVB peptidase [Tissierellaceae bacterium]